MKVQELREAVDDSGKRIKSEEEIVALVNADLPPEFRRAVLYPFEKHEQITDLLPSFLVYDLNDVYRTKERANEAFQYAFANMYSRELDLFRSKEQYEEQDGEIDQADEFIPEFNLLRKFIKGRWNTRVARAGNKEGSQTLSCESASVAVETKSMSTDVGGSMPLPTPAPRKRKTDDTKQKVFQSINERFEKGYEDLEGLTDEQVNTFYQNCVNKIESQKSADKSKKDAVKDTKPYFMGASDVFHVGTWRYHNYEFKPGTDK